MLRNYHHISKAYVGLHLCYETSLSAGPPSWYWRRHDNLGLRGPGCFGESIFSNAVIYQQGWNCLCLWVFEGAYQPGPFFQIVCSSNLSFLMENCTVQAISVTPPFKDVAEHLFCTDGYLYYHSFPDSSARPTDAGSLSS